MSQYRVSPFVQIHWRHGAATLVSTRTDASLQCEGPLYFTLLDRFREPQDLQSVQESLTDAPSREALGELLRIGALVACNDEGEPLPSGGDLWWQPEDLAFHASSRTQGLYGSYHLEGRAVRPPVRAPAASDATIELPPPAEIGTCTFETVIHARESVRRFARKAITRAQLSTWLHLSVRTRGYWLDEERAPVGVLRNYPSGGGAYSLEVYLAVAPEAIEGVEAGLYRVCPDAHRLERVRAGDAYGERAIELAGAVLRAMEPEFVPPVVVLVASRFGRVSFKYQTIPYSLVLKEVGALFQTLYLAAAATGLGVCAMGGLQSNAMFAEACGADPLELALVGEMALGVPAPEEAPP